MLQEEKREQQSSKAPEWGDVQPIPGTKRKPALWEGGRERWGGARSAWGLRLMVDFPSCLCNEHAFL